MNRLHPHNNAKQRDQAPAVVEAALYLDELQAKGRKVRVAIVVDGVSRSGESFVKAVAKVKCKLGSK